MESKWQKLKLFNNHQGFSLKKLEFNTTKIEDADNNILTGKKDAYI